MEFFEKMSERLYPVGRLDYLSEGLLLVTNDGDLANKLTKAATGVEKTYLVKVSGQPTEEELDRLRGGRGDRAEAGPARAACSTSPARIRQVRQGDNPWYEVVLIEGRNRELRKMFEEIGHFVEKIRRVGYGPLVLDVEPGQMRELDPQELALLQRAAAGKLRSLRGGRMDSGIGKLPTVMPKPTPPARDPAARAYRAQETSGTEARGPRSGAHGDRPEAGGSRRQVRNPSPQIRNRAGKARSGYGKVFTAARRQVRCTTAGMEEGRTSRTASRSLCRGRDRGRAYRAQTLHRPPGRRTNIWSQACSRQDLRR